jgi:2-polyprenyl-6-methoxyphenol hydroxylase-like FAD-dependent oxidoreductase
MAAFTVIIIGGSISGLTLANVLEKYGIKYILLEKRPSIGPQLGATVVVHPSGLHLLSQLGLKDVVEKLATPVELQKAIGPDGALLATMNYGELFKDM